MTIFIPTDDQNKMMRDSSKDYKTTLVNYFIIEVGGAIVALFYFLFGMKRQERGK